jgi:hypothetical protein
MGKSRTVFPTAEIIYFIVLNNIILMSSVFWDIRAYTPLKVNRNYGGTCRLHPQGRRISQARNQHEVGSMQALLTAYFMLVSCLAYSAPKMKATYSSETSVSFQRTTGRYIPNDRTLQNHRCENLKCYNILLVYF